MPSRVAHVARISGVFSCASKCSPQGQRGGPAAMALGGWVECLLVLSPSSKIGWAKWLFCVAWALKKRHQDCYLWSVVSLHEAVVIDRMWVGLVCVCAVRACNPQSVENPTAGFLKQKTSTSSAQQKDNRPHTTDTYKRKVICF